MRSYLQDLDGVGCIEVIERFERGRVVVTQQMPELVRVPLPSPDQILMLAGHDPQRVEFVTVAGDPTMIVTIGTHQISQHLGVRACQDLCVRTG